MDTGFEREQSQSLLPQETNPLLPHKTIWALHAHARATFCHSCTLVLSGLLQSATAHPQKYKLLAKCETYSGFHLNMLRLAITLNYWPFSDFPLSTTPFPQAAKPVFWAIYQLHFWEANYVPNLVDWNPLVAACSLELGDHWLHNCNRTDSHSFYGLYHCCCSSSPVLGTPLLYLP